MDMCRAAEASRKQLKAIKGEPQVNSIAKKPMQMKQTKITPNSTHKFDKVKTFNCKKCGDNHEPKSCPAFGKKFKLCKKLNHFAKQCRARKRIHELENFDEDSDSSDNQLYIGELKVHAVESQNQSKGDNAWYSLIKIGNKTVKFKLDTDAETNVIPKNVLSKLRNPKLHQHVSVCQHMETKP
jgi:hypothetical protein